MNEARFDKYKKGMYLEFLSNQPVIHVNDMFGHNDLGLDVFEKTKHIGIVKCIIDENTLLVTIVRPVVGFVCIANTSDIIRVVKKEELTEEESSYKEQIQFTAPNVYIAAEVVKGNSKEEKCISLAKEAMAHLFPEDEVAQYEFINSDYLKSDIIKVLDKSISYFCKSGVKAQEIKKDRDQVVSLFDMFKFKQYYLLRVNVYDHNEADHSAIDCHYMAVDLLFKEAVIMKSSEDQSRFEHSLGPGFDATMSWVLWLRDKMWSL